MAQWVVGYREGILTWRRPTLPGGYPPSTIGAGELNCRVRDGTGWTPAASATKKISLHDTPPHTVCQGRAKRCEEEEYEISLSCSAFRAETVWFGSARESAKFSETRVKKWRSPRPLVWVSCTRCRAYTAHLSSRWSTCGLTGLRHEGSHLGTCFLLRCFQQLSLPEMATERCPWQDNSHTGAPSTPVLSY